MKQMSRWLAFLAFVLLLVVQPATVLAHDAVPHGTDVPGLVRFDQRLNEQLPADLRFLDEQGNAVELSSFMGDKPFVLALSYFECETLCPLVRHGVVAALRPLRLAVGKDFDVLLVSIDPQETAAVGQKVKQESLIEYGRAESAAGWHFLRGDHDAIDQLADAIGFRYAYDGEQDEYAHPSGIVLVTPEGRVARYFFGIEYASKDVRLGLVEASQNQIGSPIDKLLLLCYHYDPTAGTYNLLIMNVVRLAGALTVGIMGLVIFYFWRRDAYQSANDDVHWRHNKL
jgi:protein SCO1/2